MAESNKIRFLIFVFLLIFPAYTLDIILSSADGDIKQKFEIKTNFMDGEKSYGGTLNQFTYQAQPNVSKVIVHISSKSRFVEIVRHAVRETRLQIAEELRETHRELVFLGIENFDDDEYHLIGAFMFEKIQPHQNQRKNFKIETIGENRFDRFYQWRVVSFSRYQENAQICGGTLLSRLRSIPRGTLRPSGRNDKEIRLHEYRPLVREVTWPIRVEGNKYVPVVNISDPKYNFKMYHPYKDIHLVIISGDEYLAVTSLRLQSSKMKQIRGFQKEMTKDKEVLIILGLFNFVWSEVDIVTQIILSHTIVDQDLDDDVCTCGFGMFNTFFRDENDRRLFREERNPSVAEIMKVLIGEEVKQRSIDMYYLHHNWELSPIPINLSNGRYFVENNIYDFRFPWLNQKIAFIVYGRSELNEATDFAIVCQSVEKLKWSGIYVVIIEAINFGLNDMHIIAEWIDHHRGNISSEQIAVLGCGIFDTIFQSEITTYNTFHNNKIELQAIQNAYVKRANEKCVFAANIDEPNLGFWTYRVNTVNGIYEPDQISDRNMFVTRGGRKLFFIVTSSSDFHKIRAVITLKALALPLRQKLKEDHPDSEWNVYLVGLDNFDIRNRDSHVFAELVKAHTNDGRSLREFLRIFHYDRSQAMYPYKDIVSFAIENRLSIRKFLTYSLGLALKFPPGTHFDWLS